VSSIRVDTDTMPPKKKPSLKVNNRKQRRRQIAREKQVAEALAGAKAEQIEQTRTVPLRRETRNAARRKRRREADAASLEDTAVRYNYDLGLSYLLGEDFVGMGKTYCKDHTEAAHWFCKAAEKGHADAQWHLGMLYEYGNGVEKSLSTATTWYRKAAEKGHADAQCDLGFLYEYGNGVGKSLSTAATWYRKAALQGTSCASYLLAWLYEDGGEGWERNLNEAKEWFRKAVDQGDEDAQGRLEDVDRKDADGSYDYETGSNYETGDGVEKDVAEAALWYRKAAEKGHARASYCLAGLYEDGGEGLERDLNEAALWFRKAAEKGHANAQCDLGLLYKYGDGVEKDAAEAAFWYRKAALQGLSRARTALHGCTKTGVKDGKET